MKIGKANNEKFVVFEDVNTNEVIRLINNAFAITIQDFRNSTCSRTEIEQNEFVGHFSSLMGMITHREGDISTCFD